jgi:hypothetical protein
MKTLILKIDYTNGTGLNGKGEFWADSYIKNMPVSQKEGESIHETVKRIIESEDHADVCYKGKPVSTVFRDTKDGNRKAVGYIYRVRHWIEDRQNNFSGAALFDAWVTIRQFVELEEELMPIETF